MKYRLPSLKRLRNLSGRTVLVRVDFNVEKTSDALRLARSLPTIKFLLAKGANVVLISHRGRPKPGLTKEGLPRELTFETTLKVVVPFLKKSLGKTPVTFVSHFDFPKIAHQIIKARQKTVFVLENLRFNVGEKEGSPDFARNLASLADLYVNDAFAVCHRQDASVTLMPQFLPSYAGMLVAEEVAQLSRVLHQVRKPLVVVLGGGKALDKFAVVKNLHDIASRFLMGGGLANTFLLASGVAVKKSIVENSILGEVKKYLRDSKVSVASDWIFDDQDRIMDIGKETQNEFAEILAKAKMVIWNGPMGFFENPQYRAGSLAVARAIARGKSFSIVGGGETTQFVGQLGIEKQFSFLSTGGGAMLQFLAGKSMPGLDALVQKR